MKVELVVVLSAFLWACSGAPFTLAEQALTEGLEPEAGQSLPDSGPLAPAPEAGVPEAAPMPTVEVEVPTVEAGAAEVGPSEAGGPEAGPVEVEASVPLTYELSNTDGGFVPLCGSESMSGSFVFLPSVVDFGTVAIGKSVTKVIKLVDIGSCAYPIEVAGLGVDDAFTDDTSCSELRLGPGGWCEFSVTFKPQSVGRATGAASGTVNGKGVSFTFSGVGE